MERFHPERKADFVVDMVDIKKPILLRYKAV